MRRILNQAFNSPLQQLPRPGIWAGLMLLAFGITAAFGTVQSDITYPGDIHETIEQLAVSTPAAIEPDIDLHVREMRLRRGDTIHRLLAEAGVHDDEAMSFLRENNQAAIVFRQLVPGKTITALVTPAGKLHSLVFPLNGGKDTALIVERKGEGLSAQVRPLELETTISRQSASIQYSLFGAADDAGIPDSIASQLADIFGGDIDFHRDLRRGDKFTVIYETTSHLGKPVRAQRILAAEFINDEKPYRAYWFPGKNGDGGYFTEDGRSVRKAFLRSPLEFSRITSGFSNARYHPVLHETRAHHGIDYAAPIGTRIKTTGDGIIEFSGVQGGYGKMVTIRHAGDRMTVYGHLSGFAPGIRKGMRVSQGDLIGYVGATGLATGPHLHYEFRVAGVHHNPLTIALPDAAPLTSDQLIKFKAHIGTIAPQIAAIGDMRLVMLD